MKLILGSFIFTKVRELIAEVIEVLDELFKLLLFGVRSVDEFEVLLLDMIEALSHTFTLNSNLSEYPLHLVLVSGARLLPYI